MDKKKRIAFTFDDGPSEQTVKLISLFSRYNAKATFFVTGENADGEFGVHLPSADFAGIEIGNHTYSHRPLSYLTDGEIEKELRDTSLAIERLTGRRPALSRPPYGDFDERVTEIGQKLGLIFVLWSVDTRDWDDHNADQIYDTIITSVNDGDIILCHDPYESTLKAIESAIPRLSEQGYELVTVSELLESSRPEPGTVHRRAKEEDLI